MHVQPFRSFARSFSMLFLHRGNGLNDSLMEHVWPSLMWIGAVNQRLSMMDLSFLYLRLQLYHRTGISSIFSIRDEQTLSNTETVESLGTNKKEEALFSWVFHFPFKNIVQLFPVKHFLLYVYFFLWHSRILHVNWKPVKAFATWGSSFIQFFTFVHSAGKPFQESFTGLLVAVELFSLSMSALKGTDAHVWCALICSCPCGDSKATNNSFRPVPLGV